MRTALFWGGLHTFAYRPALIGFFNRTVYTGPEKTIQEAVIAAGSPPNMRSITASLRGVNGNNNNSNNNNIE